jgi:hypothetical protein
MPLCATASARTLERASKNQETSMEMACKRITSEQRWLPRQPDRAHRCARQVEGGSDGL